MLPALLAGATLGAISLPHCAAMCGPLSSAICGRASGAAPALRYQVGRVAGYALMGTLFGELGGSLRFLAPTQASVLALHLCAAAAAIVIAAQLLRAPRADATLLELGRAPRAASPRQRIWTQLARLVPREPLMLGGLSALLPCGVLAAGLLAAAATTSGSHGAVLMIGFAISSGPALWFADRVLSMLRRRAGQALRRVVAVTLICVALLLVAKPLHAVVFPDPSAPTAVRCH